MSYRIAHFSDTHLGYSARCRAHSSGINMRNRDGLLGMRQTVDQIIDTDVDMVVHSGDLFHRSHPAVGEIAWARRQLERLHEAGMPVVSVTGNHDFANDRGKSPATAAVHDPSRGIEVVTEPYRIIRPVEGLNIHAVSHIGVAAVERSVPEPVAGEVNIFTSHGAAQVPGHEVFACIDSPGEAVIGYDILTMPWEVTLLGHYHGMGPLPGFDSGERGQAWYAGSLLRRGFSDPAGGRGWLLVTIDDSGTVSVERQYVDQRPQHDLPVIDATGLSGSQVEEAIRENLSRVEVGDAIMRQRVINCPLSVRRGVDTKALTDLTEDALVWQLEFTRPADPAFAELGEKEAAVESLTTAGTADLPTMFGSWFQGYAEDTGLSEEVRPLVVEAGVKLLRQVSSDSETGASEIADKTSEKTEEDTEDGEEPSVGEDPLS